VLIMMSVFVFAVLVRLSLSTLCNSV
jgi:hypothetical protein